MTITVASYLSPRPEEFPDRAHTYAEPLMLLEASCARAGCRHVVITEEGSQDAVPAAIGRDRVYAVNGTRELKLMQAIIAGQLTFLKAMGVSQEGTILVGADCLVTRDPRPVFADTDWHVGVTVGVYSPGGLNNGAVYLSPGSTEQAVAFYSLALANCPEEWGGDQESVRRVALPLERPECTVNRHGIRVRFLDMDTHNCPPACDEDIGAAAAYIAHFKGARKDFMPHWAKRQLGIERPFVVS